MLRLLSYNIHSGYSLDGRRDITRLAAFFRRVSPDVIVIQEAELHPEEGDLDRLAGEAYPYRHNGPTLIKKSGHQFGNIILSKMPFRHMATHDLDTSPDFEPRNAIEVIIDTDFGPIRIFGTHLSLAPWERIEEVRNLCRLVDTIEHGPMPVVLCGDFNEWRRRSKMIRHIDARMTQLHCRGSFPSIFPVLRLDRVWIDERLTGQAQTYNVPDMRMLSDHLPILIEIEGLKEKDQ